MSIIAGYAVRSDALALSDALSKTDVRLDLERIVATDSQLPSLFVWVEGDDLDAFDSAVEDDPTVTDVEVLSEVDEKRLYSMQMTEANEVVLYPEWVRLGASWLEVYWENGWWHARVRFPDRGAFATFRTFLEENGAEFELKRLYDGEDAASDSVSLTSEQREALKLAYERGYFEVPRQTTAAELAAELGVSDQAVSERLRRGYARLVECAIGVGQE